MRGWTADEVRSDDAHDHVCLAYDDVAEFRAQARRFLADGLARGLRTRYVAGDDGGDDGAALRAQLGGPADGRADALQFTSLAGTYRAGAVVDAQAQVRAYAAATDEALAAGFTGLRVAVDATSLVRTPHQLDAFARYEHLVERHLCARPFSAICAYDRAELGPATIAQLACLHPRASDAAATPFRLHGAPGVAAVLAGEVDLADQELFAGALDRADLQPVDGELVLDATGLEFIDHRGLLALADLAERRGCTVVLRTGLPPVGRLVELLGLRRVRVEPPS